MVSQFIKSRAVIIMNSFLMILCLNSCTSEQPQFITVVSWGGSYGDAINKGVNIPFTEATGIGVKVEDYNGGLSQIRAQSLIGDIHWDVVDLELDAAARGCDEGILEPIDVRLLPTGSNGTPAIDDFLPGTLTRCGVGNVYGSGIYAYSTVNMLESRPTTIADFFDLEAFPGRRGMRRVPQVNIEMALMADGVHRDDVYATMSTPEGLDRAFAKLETIKSEIDWWEAGAQPPQMLADGQVVMTTAYNGRIFNAQELEKQPFVIVWDGQVYSVAQIGIVAGTPRLREALEYIKFATSAESMARIANQISYSPARKSGMSLVTTHVVTGTEMEPHMPTSPANMANALPYNWDWWADHQDEMNERFSAWLAQ